jgi:hypothetical protein
LKDDHVLSSLKINPFLIIEEIPKDLNVFVSFHLLSKIKFQKISILRHRTCHLPKCCLFLLERDSDTRALVHSKVLKPFNQFFILKISLFKNNQYLHRDTSR